MILQIKNGFGKSKVMILQIKNGFGKIYHFTFGALQGLDKNKR